MKNVLAIILLFCFSGICQAQWLPPERQDYERKLWDITKVEFPEGLKFYELPIVSQLIHTVDGKDLFGIYDENYGGRNNVNALYPWATPSGLHNSPRNQWRKVAGAYFPDKIKVYIQDAQVLNSSLFFQTQPKITWNFPNRTIFVEMLIKTDAEVEYPFEIREYEVKNNKLINGTTYRPDVNKTGFTVVLVEPGKLSDFGFDSVKLKVWNIREKSKLNFNLLQKLQPIFYPFKAVREIFTSDDDNSIVPRNFLGNVRSCQDCHNQAGSPTVYGSTTIRGSKPSLSWHPFKTTTINSDQDPILDRGWDLEIMSNRLR